MPSSSFASLLLAGAALVFASADAFAHDLAFTKTLLILKADGTYQVDMTCDLDALALGAGVGANSAELAVVIRAMPPEEREERLGALEKLFARRVRVRFDGAASRPLIHFPDAQTAPSGETSPPSALGSTARLMGQIPEGAHEITFRASRSFPPVHLTLLDERTLTGERWVLEPGADSPPIALERVATAPRETGFGRYVSLGFRHIVPAGPDHVLFVLGLFLLSPTLRPLLWQVSAFTLAHTLTLGLSSYGVMSVSSAVVEPLIALSIVYVAIENTTTPKLHAWRPGLVFAFGLLHGLGFAGVVSGLGLPTAARLTALLGFNLGVELGQLVVIGAAFAALGKWRERSWYRSRVSVPLSLVIAAVGLFWAAQRIWGLA
jgi:hypothetical protein